MRRFVTAVSEATGPRDARCPRHSALERRFVRIRMLREALSFARLQATPFKNFRLGGRRLKVERSYVAAHMAHPISQTHEEWTRSSRLRTGGVNCQWAAKGPACMRHSVSPRA